MVVVVTEDLSQAGFGGNDVLDYPRENTTRNLTLPVVRREVSREANNLVACEMHPVLETGILKTLGYRVSRLGEYHEYPSTSDISPVRMMQIRRRCKTGRGTRPTAWIRGTRWGSMHPWRSMGMRA